MARLSPSLAFAASLFLAGLSACGDGGSFSTTPGGQVGAGETCTVRVRYEGDVPADSFVVSIDYSDVAGSFGATGTRPACRKNPSVAGTAFLTNFCTDDCGEGPGRYLQLDLFTGQSGDAQAIRPRSDVFLCTFSGDGSTLERMEIVNGEVLDAGGRYLSLSRVARLEWDCGDEQVTTTSTSTTSTSCGDGDCTGDGNWVEFHLDDEVALGALQLQVSFDCAAGSFELLPPEDPIYPSNRVRCDAGDIGVDLFATAQDTLVGDDGATCERRLGAGLISVQGMFGPGTALRCPFLPSAAGVSSTDFAVSVVDAVDLRDQTVEPSPSVSVLVRDGAAE